MQLQNAKALLKKTLPAACCPLQGSGVRLRKYLTLKLFFMKHLPILFLVMLIASCNNSENKDLNMVGAYAMTRQVLNDGNKDSLLDRKQLKIYTEDHIMYASPNINDSLANFGIGTYKVEDGNIVEYISYRASDGDTEDTVTLNITKTENGYTQVIDKILIGGQYYKLTEDYDEVGSNVKSPLDGAWKQVKNIYRGAKGDSSVNNNPLEYKIYQSGYFIWAITIKDSANKASSVFGYGRFEMDGENKMKETIQNSTFVQGLIGKTYEVALEFDGKNKYSQTITFANGDRSTEIYERFK